MYGLRESDPVVLYYDLAFGITGPAERQYYVNKMAHYGGPVLDLAGGSGRFGLEALALGHEVTYVDASEGMAALFRDKLATLDPAWQSRVDIVPARMSEFVPRRRYGLVLCCDAFFHNLTSAQARSTLTAVRRALNHDGAFVFNLHFASPTFLCWARSPESGEWHPRGQYPIPDSADVLHVDQALQVDFISQIIDTRLRFRRVSATGDTLDESFSRWTTRYFNRFEIEHLIELCGLRVVETLGYYDGRPVDEKGQLIYTCAAA